MRIKNELNSIELMVSWLGLGCVKKLKSGSIKKIAYLARSSNAKDTSIYPAKNTR